MSLSHPFTARLIAWQQQAGRHDLPWQNTRDPYRIWLSEIMLQQTQVITVIPYYQRFLARFPDVLSLAAASIDEVIPYWAGLGYYARARNLHRCAQVIATVHGGHFPKTALELAELPGIGRSTAAAVAAFAFGAQSAILDGNVKRVLCRQFGIEGFPGAKAVETGLWQLAERLLPEHGIEIYTQGLMDLGATVCTRNRPKCGDCPVAEHCVARLSERQAVLPEARPRAAIPERSTAYVMLIAGNQVLLERRPSEGLWGGLLSLPEGGIDDWLGQLGSTLRSERPLPPLRHTFTHFRLTLQTVIGEITRPNKPLPAGLTWVDLDAAPEAGVPTPIRTLLKQAASGRR